MKLRFLLGLFALTTLSFPSSGFAGSAEKWMFENFLMDRVQYVLCVDRPCSNGTLRAIGELMSSEIARRGISTDFNSSAFCACKDQPTPLQNGLTPAQITYVQQTIEMIGQVLSQQSRPTRILDVLTERGYDSWAQYVSSFGDGDAHMNALDFAQHLSTLGTLRSQPRSFYKALIREAFVTGGLRNPVQNRAGCRGSAPFDASCILPQEYAAAKRYMGHEFGDINLAIHTKKHGPYATTIRDLNTLLGKLTPVNAVSFRGIGPKEYFHANVKVGESFIDPGFGSSSLQSRVAQRFVTGTGMIMFTRTCSVVSGLGELHAGEDEVLCPPSTRLQVIHKESLGGTVYLILEEI